MKRDLVLDMVRELKQSSVGIHYRNKVSRPFPLFGFVVLEITERLVNMLIILSIFRYIQKQAALFVESHRSWQSFDLGSGSWNPLAEGPECLICLISVEVDDVADDSPVPPASSRCRWSSGRGAVFQTGVYHMWPGEAMWWQGDRLALLALLEPGTIAVSQKPTQNHDKNIHELQLSRQNCVWWKRVVVVGAVKLTVSLRLEATIFKECSLPPLYSGSSWAPPSVPVHSPVLCPPHDLTALNCSHRSLYGTAGGLYWKSRVTTFDPGFRFLATIHMHVHPARISQ